MGERRLTDWNTDLFDCFEDASTCCYGCWCGPCLACTVSGRFGERYCLPMLDISTTGSQILPIPAFVPPVAVSMRAAMRSRYGIKGSIAADIAASYYCAPCSWCQMHRELKHRKKAPVVINTQQPYVINMQPPAMMMMPPGAMAPQVAMAPQGALAPTDMSQPQTIKTSK
uniref:Cornifelin n=1 Tax=Oryzias sinensis TaxID=183150 RepID=A0A8C7Z861_9TELE